MSQAGGEIIFSIFLNYVWDVLDKWFRFFEIFYVIDRYVGVSCKISKSMVDGIHICLMEFYHLLHRHTKRKKWLVPEIRPIISCIF